MSISSPPGDCNNRIEDILAAVPEDALAFCLLDPYKLGNLHFDTIEAISARRADFLVLIPTHMDAHRNQKSYLDGEDNALDRFLGMHAWRTEWRSAEREPCGFGDFVAGAVGRRMESLGYLHDPANAELFRTTDARQLRLYRLAFFSRHELGNKFWRAVQRYSPKQRSLF